MYRFIKLPSKEKRLLIQVAFLFGLIRGGLRLLPFSTVQRLLAWHSVKSPQASEVREDEGIYRQQVVWAAKAAGRRMLGNKPCLTQALAVQWMLRRRGYDAELHIGVKKGEMGQPVAHAWLEHKGMILIGGRVSPLQFTQLRPLKVKRL